MFHKNGPSLFELARQALSETTAGYDMLAPKFEYTPFRTPDALLAPLITAANRESVRTALDAACGNGAIARALTEVVTEAIVGIDISEGMLVEARRLRDPEERPTTRFEKQDVFKMNYDEAFDLVCTACAFGHILAHQQDDFVKRVYRALRPGGRFIFITSKMPSVSNPAWWMARGFNATMHVRNTLRRPPFIMFYLTFTVERAAEVLWRNGFDVAVEAPYRTPYNLARLVTATKR